MFGRRCLNSAHDRQAIHCSVRRGIRQLELEAGEEVRQNWSDPVPSQASADPRPLSRPVIS